MNNKKNDAILIIIMLLIVIGGIVGGLFFITKGFKHFEIFIKTTINDNKVYNKTYEEKFENIIINANSAYIEVKKSEDLNFKLVIYDNDDKNLSIENDKNRLLISVKTDNCKGFCFNRVVPKIELYIPENYNGNMSIDSKYGDIKIASFEKLNLSAKLDSGDIIIAKLNEADINNHYGDIKIIDFANKLSIDADCGDIKINEVNSIKANNAYGDIKIEKINKDFNIKDNCGDIKLGTINIAEDSTIEDDLGDITINGTNDINIVAKTDLGNVKINKNNEDSFIKLTITNNMGDIKINN